MKATRTLVALPIVVCLFVFLHESQNNLVLECGTVFNSETTFDSLVEEFGANNVIEAELHENEGFYELGALIFPGSQDEVEIFWHDPQTGQALRKARIKGNQSSWQIRSGLELGMDLLLIEAHNRKPFRLYGFSWDYGGTIASWEEGDLEQSGEGACRIVVRLDADFSKVPWELIVKNGNVIGDTVFSSGHPTMQLLNPTIAELSLLLD